MSKREQIDAICDDRDEKMLVVDGHDDAILGIASRFGMDDVVAYDYEKVIAELAKDMSRDEAEEFFQFNILGAWCGEGTPLFVTLL